MPKNIVICCDGTGNQVSTDPSNVMRLWGVLQHDPSSQIAFYDPGVGTLGDPRSLTFTRRKIRKALDAAVGLSIRDNFIEAYTFLARVYQPDDRIFLFGFSRGAYTARAVAGAVHLFGLLRPENANLAPYVWRTYSNDDGDEESETLFKTAARFRERFAVTVPIHFVGVWDTVSSFGPITQFRTLPHTRSNPSVRAVRHAVAIDERRACFRANVIGSVAGQDLQEVWFAGAHSDVGGGYPEPESGLSKIPFEWIVRHAITSGLLVDNDRFAAMLRNPGPDAHGPQHESLVGWWRMLELLPQRRFNFDKKRLAWRLPNLFRRRNMQPEGSQPPVVHGSVRIRMKAGGYRPVNLPENAVWLDDNFVKTGDPAQ